MQHHGAIRAIHPVSPGVNPPGVYGRVNMGEPVPQAAWVNARPAVITQTPVAVQRQPIDPYALPAHSKQLVALSRPLQRLRPARRLWDRWVRNRHAQALCGNNRDRDGYGLRNSRGGRPNNPNRR